jgi:hypothetical protein
MRREFTAALSGLSRLLKRHVSLTFLGPPQALDAQPPEQILVTELCGAAGCGRRQARLPPLLSAWRKGLSIGPPQYARGIEFPLFDG